MLVDVVSRNGNLMLNFPLPNSGMLDKEELAILEEITDWMRVNGEAIYATRPWKISGTGPGSAKSAADETNFNENARKPLTSNDVRFTTKGGVLFALVMGVPEKQALVAPLAAGGAADAGKIAQVELLGFPGKLTWRQDSTGLSIELPATKPCKHALAFRIHGAI
ncbi:MAG TPA: alpha-L-fucosidase, partial [Candidatus Bathyarchaeia archaeon]|nr:alpha-L-fucosidase [Candidatus Bathyarchaeia archaeon]